MNAHLRAVVAPVAIPDIASEGRVPRAIVATAVIAGYMAAGFTFALSAEGYLLPGIPITIASRSL